MKEIILGTIFLLLAHTALATPLQSDFLRQMVCNEIVSAFEND